MAQTSDVERILDVLLNHRDGYSLAELLERFPALSRRTAQRLLSAWTAEGRVHRQGHGRNTRYAPPAGDRGRSVVSVVATFPEAIPVSADSRDVLAYVSQPLEARTPVGYDSEFLDAYEPGRPYLSDTLRRQLHRMGDTGQGERPAGTYGREVLDRRANWKATPTLDSTRSHSSSAGKSPPASKLPKLR